jgi:hypothetical protein
MPKTTIRVTLDDIALGLPSNCSKCPVAIAATKAGVERAQINTGLLFGYVSGRHFIARLPERVDRWVGSFDAGYHVDPITFDVEMPA